MSKKFLSFVFPETTKKQIDSMSTAEMKLKFYEAVSTYGMYGIEPEELTEIETLIWIPMKDLIDNSKESRGGAPSGNMNAKKQNSITENNQKTTETTKPTENNQNNQKTTETTLNNGNGNGNGNGNNNYNNMQGRIGQ